MTYDYCGNLIQILHSQRFFHANIFQVRAIAIILLSLNLKEGRKLHKTTQYSTVQYSTVQFSLLLHVFGVWCGGEICTRCATPRPTIECESSIILFHPPSTSPYSLSRETPPPILASTPHSLKTHHPPPPLQHPHSSRTSPTSDTP